MKKHDRQSFNRILCEWEQQGSKVKMDIKCISKATEQQQQQKPLTWLSRERGRGRH